MRVKALET